MTSHSAGRLGALALTLLLASPLRAAVPRLSVSLARPCGPVVALIAAPVASISAAPVAIPSLPKAAPALAAAAAPAPIPEAPKAAPAAAAPAAEPAAQAAPSETPRAIEQLHAAEAAWAKPRVGTGDAAPAAKPFPLGRRARVTASFFDIDDNLFLGLPTKIIAFHKKTGAELPLSTEEYARVRGLIGRAGSPVEIGGRALDAGDYELRWGSFREFRDPPDGNNFIAGLKWVVENLPPERWQGPSWEAFVRALSDPDTAASAAIVTARAHRTASFLEAFDYLRERGLIAHLPPAENLHPVGDNGDPAVRKLEAVSGLLDRVQASPFGADAGTVLSPDGTGRRTLHSAGFSDDDPGNFTTMAEGLSAALRAAPRRWDKVKIVLFYTGTDRRGRAPGGYVLTPQGRLRKLKASEEKEALTTRKGRRP